jgi:hypothetical protein
MRTLGTLCVLGLFSLSGCESNRWESLVYPNKNDLTQHRSLGSFPSLEACRAAARRYLADLGALERGDYECGKNCKDSTSFREIRICDETLR